MMNVHVFVSRHGYNECVEYDISLIPELLTE
jgi:hypothetical protein